MICTPSWWWWWCVCARARACPGTSLKEEDKCSKMSGKVWLNNKKNQYCT